MAKRIWSLVLVLVVAVCGMLFVACGKADRGENVSLSIASGLDSGLNAGDLSRLSEELSLSDFEKTNVSRGVGYDAKVVSNKTVTLIVGSEKFGSRDILVKINGWVDGMGSLINFSSDSSKVSISKIEYLNGGYARATITGLEAGTAEITVISGQYSKSETFTVKVLQLPTNFAVKPDAIIYLEKNSRLTVDVNEYINFYPTTTNMRDLEFYVGDALLTNNGKTVLSSIAGDANSITRDTTLTIKSTRLQDGQNVESILVRVVDNISQFEMKKLVYNEIDEEILESYESLNSDNALTVITNSVKTYANGQTISYGKRDIFVIVKNSEEDLQLLTKVYINGVEENVLILPIDHEFISQSTYAQSNYADLISEYISGTNYAFHVFKFEVQYTGYDNYDIEFSFGVERYVYAESKTLSVSFKSASDLVDFRKVGDADTYDNYVIYDGYSGVYGTRFLVKTNVAAFPYDLQLVFGSEVYDNFRFLTTTGNLKTAIQKADDYILTLSNNENFYIQGKEGSVGEYVLTVRVVYTHDNIIFSKSKVITINVKPAPHTLEFNLSNTPSDTAGQSNITEYNFDLNISGKLVGDDTDYVNGKKTLSLYLHSYARDNSRIGEATDFSIQNTSNVVSVQKDSSNKLTITALSIGKGSFTVILGNNVKATFLFNVIESVSAFEITFPTQDQNENVFSLVKNYSYRESTYNNYLIALKDRLIPTIISKSGDLKSVNISCADDSSCLTYSNGFIRTNKDFNYNIINVNITYNYIDENNEIQIAALVLVDKILISSITNISNFSILTEANTSSFTLYDYSSVGYYAVNLAQKTINVRIDPSELSGDFLKQIKWSTNLNIVEESGTEEADTEYILKTDVFEFRYNKTSGVGILRCHISPDKHPQYYDERGKFKEGSIVLTGRIDRGDYGVYSKSIQFNVKKNDQVEVLMPSTNEVFLDMYSDEYELTVNLFPSSSVNQNLAYIFFPYGELSSNAISWVETSSGNSKKLKIKLEDYGIVGSGRLRIIAMDSAYANVTASEENYAIYIDVRINITNGSKESPYVISSIQSVQKMIDTNFEKHYEIHGRIDLSKTNWEFNKYTLSGSITGKNNAELLGVVINDIGKNELGLFKDISETGKISDIKISGSINVDYGEKSVPTGDVYIGLLAGKNKGKIEDVYVALNDSAVFARGRYSLFIGGVVGINLGIISTNIKIDSTYTRLIQFKGYLNFADKSSGDGKKLYLGGVAGHNSDIIKRSIDSGLKDFNNNFATAEVLIKAEHAGGIYDVAIGGICGRSYLESTSAGSGIYGVLATGEILASDFNNVGGLVGVNSLNLQGSTAQVYVRGKQNVGGAVGYNYAEITSGGDFDFGVRVEALESHNLRTGLSSSFITGENYVGGIIGRQSDTGSLESSSFISYMEGGSDILILGIADTALSFGLITGENSGVYDYVVGVGAIQFAIEEYSVEQSPIDELTGNYAVFGIFINELLNQGIYESDGNYKTYEDRFNFLGDLLKEEEKDGFNFIIVPPTEANIKLIKDGKDNELFSENEEEQGLAFYLFYYQSTEEFAQNKINENSLNKYSVNKFISYDSYDSYDLYDLYGVSISIEKGSSFLEIGANNEFIVKGVGQVILKISTPYNASLEKYIYIYICNYINNISVYKDSEQRSEISTNSEVKFDASADTSIYFYFLDKARFDNYNYYGLVETTGIDVLAKVNDTYIVKANGEIHSDAKFGLIKDNYNMYRIITNGEVIDSTSIEFIPYIEAYFNGVKFTSYLTNEKATTVIKTDEDGRVIDKINDSNNLRMKDSVKFKYSLANLTKSISVTNDNIETEPYYEVSTSVIFDSLDTNERLTIKIDMLRDDGTIDSNFETNLIKIVAKWGGDTFENGSVNERRNVFYVKPINAKTNNVVTISFKIEDGYKEFSKNKVFVVTFISRNNKSAQIRLVFVPQKQMDVSTILYDKQSEPESSTNYFSYIPSSYMIPGQTSLIEFNIVPSYTNYKYIDIVNIPSNEANILFAFFDRANQKDLAGGSKIDNGIRLSKSLIGNGKFYLRSFLDMGVSDNSNISIKIILRDEAGEELSSKIVTFYIQHLPGVVLTIDGVSSGNTEQSRLRLARGLSYDLTVLVRGFNSGNLIRNGNIYTDGEVTFEVSGNTNLVTIVKNSDGTYKLVVTGSSISQRFVSITTYGEKITNEGLKRSRETTIYIEVDEFVIKDLSEIGDIIKDAINGVITSAVGNSYEFEVSLNDNILFYDRSNAEIVNQVNNFLISLSNGVINENKIGVWFYQDLNKTSTSWARVVAENSSFVGSGSEIKYKVSNGAFVLTFNKNTQKLKVSFQGVENAAAPTFRFRYYANYIYENGLPKLVTTNNLESINEQYYNLEQVFRFDISERTSLRNPYPIYSYEELLNMREGNYYVLLNDIIVPSNFTPITTRIGGLDGNNHKIIIRDIDLVGTEIYNNLSFGFFAETAENTLLENIIIYIERTVSINTYNYSNVVLGLLVGNNYGKVTNCAIEGANHAVVNVNLFGLSSSENVTNEIGGLVGVNYGEITHSRVEVGIAVNDDTIIGASYMAANLGGITSINKSDATIASSYVNARIENNTTTFAAKTGGVVAVNESNARIFTTYIVGEYTDSNKPFADDENIVVYSRASAGAFAYENIGTISNCYANIKMLTNESSSGFVFANRERGSISYCYSTSLVASKEGNAANSAFIGILKNVIGKDSILNYGELKECYYLQDESYNVGIGSNSGFDELKKLDENSFKNRDTFAKFAFSQTTDKSDGVWFFPSPSGVEGSFIRNGSPMVFRSSKPELVAPNIISAGSKTFNYSTFNTETGITEYHYYEPDSPYSEGSKFNPYIISSPEDMENIRTGARNFITEEAYYRIVCDIIYETSIMSSSLYKYSFLGKIEGNGFVIGNYVLDSMESLENAGFFATIGTQSKQVGSIKNLTFAPRYISLTNSNCVGAVAGRTYSTTLVNVSVDGFSYSSSAKGVVILGRNCIGGVVGKAMGDYKFNEISSNISVNSSYRSILDNGSEPGNQGSFAGLILGVAEGYGKLQNLYAYGENVSIAECAGFIFGYVGKNVSADIIKVESGVTQYVKAEVYGGIIAGHSEGTLKNITIINTGSKSTFFVTESFPAIAIGNLVGYMTGGKIEKAEVKIPLKTSSSVKYVGGAVGFMRAGELKDVIIDGNITAGATIGGLVGYVLGATPANWKVTIYDCYHNGNIDSVSSAITIRLGSIIGYADVELSEESEEKIEIEIETSQSFLTNSKPAKIINVSNFVYSEDIQIWIGLIVFKGSEGNRGKLSYDYLSSSEPTPESQEKLYNISKSSNIFIAKKDYKLNGNKYKNNEIVTDE